MGEKSKEEFIILILSEYNLFQIKSCEKENQNFSLEILYSVQLLREFQDDSYYSIFLFSYLFIPLH